MKNNRNMAWIAVLTDSTAVAQTLARETCVSYGKDVTLTIDVGLQNGRWASAV